MMELPLKVFTEIIPKPSVKGKKFFRKNICGRIYHKLWISGDTCENIIAWFDTDRDTGKADKCLKDALKMLYEQGTFSCSCIEKAFSHSEKKREEHSANNEWSVYEYSVRL